jgi:alpha-ribazole phosphatase
MSGTSPVSAVTDLWLVRHPEPEESARGRCYGSLDVQLSQAGLAQAHAAAEKMGRVNLSAIYSSPSHRCLQAAEYIAARQNCAAQVVEDLRELNFGEFEGRAYDDIAASHPEFYREWMEHPTAVRFPGGECFEEMQARVLASLNEIRIRHAGESVGIVTHGGVIRIIIAHILGIPAVNLFRIAQRYGGITLVRFFGAEPCVELLNGPPGIE